jgi:hypothetical protein
VLAADHGNDLARCTVPDNAAREANPVFEPASKGGSS